MKNVNKKQAEEQHAVDLLVRLGNGVIGSLSLDEPDRQRLNDEPDSSIWCDGKQVGVEVTKVWDGLSEEEQEATAKEWALSGKLDTEIQSRLQGICSGMVSVNLDHVPKSGKELKEIAGIVVDRVKLLKGGKTPNPLDRKTYEVDVTLYGGDGPLVVMVTDCVGIPEQSVLEQAVRDAIDRKKGIVHELPDNWLLLTDHSLAGLHVVDLDLNALRDAVAPGLVDTTWTRILILLGSATAQPVLLQLL